MGIAAAPGRGCLSAVTGRRSGSGATSSTCGRPPRPLDRPASRATSTDPAGPAVVSGPPAGAGSSTSPAPRGARPRARGVHHPGARGTARQRRLWLRLLRGATATAPPAPAHDPALAGAELRAATAVADRRPALGGVRPDPARPGAPTSSAAAPAGGSGAFQDRGHSLPARRADGDQPRPRRLPLREQLRERRHDPRPGRGEGMPGRERGPRDIEPLPVDRPERASSPSRSAQYALSSQAASVASTWEANASGSRTGRSRPRASPARASMRGTA